MCIVRILLVIIIGMLILGTSAQSQLINLGFNENTGSAVANAGSVSATFTKTAPPAWSTNVPTHGGVSSVDFGTTVGNYYVESGAVISELAGLTSFTVTGWVNCKDLTVGSGGNRIVSWINNGANGVDIVHAADGSMKVGINQWPDGSIAISSTGKITTDTTAGASNWRFFAVTYESSTSTLNFYFGDNSTQASFDKTITYNQGAVGASIGKLAIGHFNSESSRASRTNRMFKGLIDQVEIYGSVLSLAEIQAVQNIGPSLSVNPTSLNFGNVVINTTSIERTYVLSGGNLTPSDSLITITAPSGYEVSETSGSGFSSSITAAYTGGTISSKTIYVRFNPTVLQSYNGNITNAGGGATTVNAAVSGVGVDALVPILSVNPTSLSFGNVAINTTSSERTYALTGTDLSPASGNITITAPTAYEISQTSGSGFSSSIIVAYTNGAISSKTIYTRFKPTAVQSYSGSITNAGGGASTQNVAVSGDGIDLLPGQQLAFPTADGYGKYVTGGRGGAVIEVTSLNDDNNPGSLRYAVNQSGPRTIVFRVSGTIALTSNINITNGDLTIAGQTAPGDGICVKNYKFNISASNVIIRYMRFRLGDAMVWEDDAFGGYSPKASAGSGSLPVKNIMIDHCSVSYGSDETLSIYDIENLTVQWCIISESLNRDGHGFGGIMGGWGASLHHTLFAQHKSRSPRFCGARYQFNLQREVVDMRNNVIYRGGHSYGGEGGHHNVVNNYYKSNSETDFCNPSQPNPSETDNEFVGCIYDSIKSYWYINGNYIYGNPTQTADNWSGGGVKLNYPSLNLRVYDPFPSEYFGQNETAEQAFVRVCNEAGATLPKRDTVDKRVINDVINNTGSLPDTMGNIPSPAFPTLNSLPAPTDSDNDGMPDVWELAHGLNPNNASDRNNIGQDGYTQLEVYLGNLTGEIPTGVDDAVDVSRPVEFALHQNYPNPFNPTTTITYSVVETYNYMSLRVYDVLGREVATLVNEVKPAGKYTVQFNASHLASGIYYAQLRAGALQQTIKLILAK